jgi:uncharacterized membrane protein HdeD (DUF308 family)
LKAHWNQEKRLGTHRFLHAGFPQAPLDGSSAGWKRCVPRRFSEEEKMSTAMEAIAHRSSKSSLILAIILILLGVLAITLPTATSIGAVKVLGWLIIFGGFAQLVHAFQSEGVGRIAWKILVALLYLVGGAYLLANPLLGVAGLTLALAIFFFAEGVMDLLAYFGTQRNDRSGWLLFHGIVSVVFGLIIWTQWPSSSLWVIGTIVGISMFMSGFSRLFMALEARKHARYLGNRPLAGNIHLQ